MNTKLTEIYEAISKFPTVESIGLGDPKKVSTDIFRFVTKHVPVDTDMRILDLGCGLGRSSTPFVDYLSGGRGHLVGVDVIERMAAFCRKVIGARYANASFYACAVPESYLNDQQRENPSRLLPIEEILVQHQPFDLVIAFSVFTHLLPEEMDAYFSLFDRILTPDGRLVLTFLFLDEWTRPKVRNRALPSMILPDTPNPMPELGRICFASPSNPRAVVAISFDDVLAMVKAHGFQPEQIHFGSWRGLPSETFQDALILQREHSIPMDFEPNRYLELHKDVARSGIDPVQHYLIWGKQEGRAYK
jgi:SAM-dependent methyltransferase